MTGILGYKNNSKALADHTSEDDRKPLKYVDCNDSLLSKMWLGKDRKDKVFVNESGLECLYKPRRCYRRYADIKRLINLFTSALQIGGRLFYTMYLVSF